MIRDSSGIDAVAGCLVLILVCTGLSISTTVMQFPDAPSDRVDPLRIVDCLLSSDIILEFSAGGQRYTRIVPISELLERVASGAPLAGSGAIIGDPLATIGEMIDFYVDGRCGWNLSLGFGNRTTDSFGDPIGDFKGADAEMIEKTFLREPGGTIWARFAFFDRSSPSSWS